MSAHRLTTRSRILAWLTILLIGTLPALAGDQQKADKQCRRITAITADAMARSIVSQSIADFLGVERMQLVRERHALNLSYGSLFLAHELTPAGAPMAATAAQLQNDKNLATIAPSSNANWHAIAEAGRRLNAKIEDDIYKHFLHDAADKQLIPADKYNPDADIVKADTNISPEEVAQAHQIYVFWRDRAAPNHTTNLDSASQTIVGKSADVFKGGDRPR